MLHAEDSDEGPELTADQFSGRMRKMELIQNEIMYDNKRYRNHKRHVGEFMEIEKQKEMQK